ncbi:preprotein translocase subunit YajC [Lactobacillus sp. PV037]|uniref:preprotein translocase subunit YajC n=1 Tax=unclassified Lactobacillus TaxID=2620435 RepID=UPI0022404A3E|nr:MULTISPECIES: preprotein translocase subunit YajC [unclassified Lactobacillus]QNQ81905.1 preprotein translocase subunit YajC [Lactobacillus sp. PV012]QNQ84059.1 preprotein translocase subunit YajC [Lactobacillus sp. PV037]
MDTLFLAQKAAGGNNIFMIVIFIVFIAFFYFAMLRPQKKQQQKRMEMMSELKKGDRVILVDGLHAKIDSINKQDNTIVVDADGILLTFSRMAIRQVMPNEEQPVDVEKQEAEDSSSSNDDKETTKKSDSKQEEKDED